MNDERDRMIVESRPGPQRLRLFRSDRLERLTLISPAWFVATWTVILALVLWASVGTASFASWSGLVLLGLLLWTLFEYALHRFMFHLKLGTSAGAWLVFLMHGNHHIAPSDQYRNLMPPIVSIAILASFWCLFLLLLGGAGSALFLGFAIGYVLYDTVHYACHQFPMHHRLLRPLRRHHIRHHYGKQDGNYAITAIFWDRVFGTAVPTKQRPSTDVRLAFTAEERR